MSYKDLSSWFKKLVIVVLDDSVFWSWLFFQGCVNDFEDCYGKFFSGQFGICVYGFWVLSFGVSIDGLLYLFFFDFIKKNFLEFY